MNKINQVIFTIMVLLGGSFASTATVFNFNDSLHASYIGKSIQYFEDTSGRMSFDEIKNSGKFIDSKDNILNFKITNSSIWLKCEISNETYDPKVYLMLAYPMLDIVELYVTDSNGLAEVFKTGEQQPVAQRKFNEQNFIFDVLIPHGLKKTCYFKIKSSEQILIPLSVGTYQSTFDSLHNQDLFTAIYLGIFLVMIFYNFFVYLTVRDKSYLIYVIYIFFVGLTQLALQGYSYRYFWPGVPELANQSVIFFPAITGIIAIEFFKNFLHIREFSRKFIWVLNALNVFYVINCILSISGKHQLSQELLQPNAMLASLIIVGMSVSIIRKGSRSAAFFLIAWITFLAGIIIFILKDLSIFPYNIFTNSILEIGSAIEVVVLSFALADKINTYRKEKDIAQAEALTALKENERIINEQNVLLEEKVEVRTHELKLVNEDLNVALTDLKNAQTQLVESEKMASLGQLTAGIAHEINNPINFVTSNIKPLNRDVYMLLDTIENIERIVTEDSSNIDKKKQIEEYKTEIDFDYLKIEIDQLLNGIGEGANRTAEIVKGLRVFSRLDEHDLKKADINEGLESTLVIVNNILGDSIKLTKNLGNLPLVECYPGKLNQVFLNIISNAIHAINKKFGGKPGGGLIITTLCDEKNVIIKIADNGTGMTDQVKQKLFEPFFTTKEVGEGTGLGLSIAYSTVLKHNGHISVNSELGIGTEFILTLPLTQK